MRLRTSIDRIPTNLAAPDGARPMTSAPEPAGGRPSAGLEPPASRRRRARAIAAALAKRYPGDARSLCPLVHRTPFELLVATVLSAQCTDQRVNALTPGLFARYPDAWALAAADQGELETLIHSAGFFRTKAHNLRQLARALVEDFGGEVPRDLEALTSLAGVGRKTANVVRSVDFDLPGFPVDTHVTRLSRRLGLSEASDATGIEADLCRLWPPKEWGALSLRLILHGRETCIARRPRCEACVLAKHCPSATSPPPAQSKRAKGRGTSLG